MSRMKSARLAKALTKKRRLLNLSRAVYYKVLALVIVLLASSVDSRAGQFNSLGESERILGKIGTVTGTVSVAGDFQRPKPLPVFKNRLFCGARVPNETLLVDRQGGLQNAVLTFEPLDRKAAARPTQLILDNKQCAFVPHVQVATIGSELLLKNSDPILHTVHARLGRETLFNVGLPAWRQVTKRLDRAGVIRIDCDVLHTWMSAAIIVTETPHFALSDANGKFIVDQLPVGAYQVTIWHEKLGVKSLRLDLDSDKSLSVDMIYGSSDR